MNKQNSERNVMIRFQNWRNKYSLNYLIFGGVLIVQRFILDWKKRKTSFVSMAVGLLLFPIFFHGSVAPAYAADEVSPPSFGQGPVKVRLYTDYFCPPCRAMEAKIEPVLSELIKKNVITLTFVDTPFYQYSSMYARYFLYAMKEKRDIDTALRARNVLIRAAIENIRDAGKLEEALNNKGINFTVFDVKPIFAVFGVQLGDDKVEATPSCVIEQNGKKELFKGGRDIVSALEKVLKLTF